LRFPGRVFANKLGDSRAPAVEWVFIVKCEVVEDELDEPTGGLSVHIIFVGLSSRRSGALWSERDRRCKRWRECSRVLQE
jgi:hypothetical protein